MAILVNSNDVELNKMLLVCWLDGDGGHILIDTANALWYTKIALGKHHGKRRNCNAMIIDS